MEESRSWEVEDKSRASGDKAMGDGKKTQVGKTGRDMMRFVHQDVGWR